ncbi:MAG: rod shape-determining protein MreC [Deltaproteobacteria bacterium]|nr:rod shape-determining protein MreC [Deltaproteobacteria bacterium]
MLFVSVFLSLISLHMVTTSERGTGGERIVGTVILAVSRPIQQVSSSTGSAIAGVWNGYIYLIGLRDENAGLKNKVDELTAENNALKETLIHAKRAEELGIYSRGLQEQTTATVTADIVAFSGLNLGGGWARTFLVNKGIKDGIDTDMAVVTPEGVIGRVVEVTRSTSRVLLLTDPRSNIDVTIQRTRVKGVVEGDNTGALRLNYVKMLDDAAKDDVVITAGLAGIYPKGLIVGKVAEVRESEDKFFKNIIVNPAADITKIESVLIITSRQSLPLNTEEKEKKAKNKGQKPKPAPQPPLGKKT